MLRLSERLFIAKDSVTLDVKNNSGRLTKWPIKKNSFYHAWYKNPFQSSGPIEAVQLGTHPRNAVTLDQATLLKWFKEKRI